MVAALLVAWLFSAAIAAGNIRVDVRDIASAIPVRLSFLMVAFLFVVEIESHCCFQCLMQI